MVFPADYFSSYEAVGFESLKAYSQANDVDLEIGYGATATEAPKSVLIASNGKVFTYMRTHRERGESIPKSELSNEYLVVNRDYGRVALMQGTDMIPPETALVMAQMGVDVIAVNADSSNPLLGALWQDRSEDDVNVVVANKAGENGIYLGGFQDYPYYTESGGDVIRNIDTAHDRPKPYARFFDYEPLLKSCRKAADNC